jgi:hypothetical protein
MPKAADAEGANAGSAGGRASASTSAEDRCKECGGAGICQHQRRRSRCKECCQDADESMPAGLEELGEGVDCAGVKVQRTP